MQSLEFVGPKAILSAVLPRSQPTLEATDAAEVRRAAFKRFIAAVERRGSSENVPEFPVGAQWYNTGARSAYDCFDSLILFGHTAHRTGTTKR